MKFYKKLTYKLKKDDIKQIIKLKNSHWKFSFSSQLKWFRDKKNLLSTDYNFYLKKKKKIISYVHLGKRKCLIGLKKSNYILFRTLIISKHERENNLSQLIMQNVQKFVKKKNLPCFLLCKKKLIPFYMRYEFILLNKKKFKIKGHKSNLYGMIFNLSKKKFKNLVRFNYNNT